MAISVAGFTLCFAQGPMSLAGPFVFCACVLVISWPGGWLSPRLDAPGMRRLERWPYST